jgi:hypothetical protein
MRVRPLFGRIFHLLDFPDDVGVKSSSPALLFPVAAGFYEMCLLRV